MKSRPNKGKFTRLFFAADVHGSEKCWHKLMNAGAFYDVDTIVLGGDVIGKGIQILLQEKPGTWRTDFLGERVCVEDQASLSRLEARIRTAGLYPYRASRDEAAEFYASRAAQERVFQELVTRSLQRWLELAEAKLKGSGRRMIAIPGNDDPPFIDELFQQSTVITWAQRQVVRLDETHEMINEGFSNPTPWHTFRELDEERLLEVLEQQIGEVEDLYNAVFNLHAPPYGSRLDEAPLLDEKLRLKDGGRTFVPVGSTAVRRVIETYQPLLSLHGHIHEGRGSTYIGRTLCINSGSTCIEGVLSGYLINLDREGIRAYQPVQG